jgi:hypothetical protein
LTPAPAPTNPASARSTAATTNAAASAPIGTIIRNPLGRLGR